MTRRITAVFGTVAGLMAVAPSAAALEIGDAAPPLKIKEWVRGEAVNLSKDAAKRIHMVEFWATWCPPCKQSIPLLNDYQKKNGKDLVIIGVTDPDPYRNSASDVKDFVKEQGAEMGYSIALDDEGQTTRAYMSSEVIGIPYAYLVGRDGKVVWHGSPLDPSLEKIIPDVVSGKYDVAQAKKAAELEVEVAKRFQTLELAYQLGKDQAVWDGAVDILRIDASNETAMHLLATIQAGEPQKVDAFRRWAKDHIAGHRTNVKTMMNLAEILGDHEDLATRAPDLALDAAKAAYEASAQRDSHAVAGYARALYQIGDVDKAISLQKDAAALATGDDKETAQKVLDFYLLCKKLQASN